jgi:hypothetical protein
MHPYVLNWRNPWDGETGFYKEDPAKHTLGFYEDLVQEAAEDLGIEDSPLLPGGDTPDDEDLIPDGGLSWEQVSHEYWMALKQFESRHPPRYVDPEKPIYHDTVEYFPHRHFQQGVREAAGSQERYERAMDAVRFKEYGVDTVLE